MSTPNRKSLVATLTVAAAAALAGFGAIYLTLGTGDNGRVDTAPARVAGIGEKPVITALPNGPGSNPLSQGTMAMFVFKDAPAEIEALTFNDQDGKPIGLADFKGRVILLNLWATWCTPCRKEMPDLDRLQKELGSDDFQVVAISLDRGSPEKSRKFLAEINVEHLQLYHDPTARLGTQLRAIGMPTTLLIGRDGREIGRLVGPAEWFSDEAKRLIRAALG